MATHVIEVTINLADGESVTPAHVTVENRPYDMTDEQALQLLLPGGEAPVTLDFATVPGYVRFGATMVPADRFRSLTASIVAKSQ